MSLNPNHPDPRTSHGDAATPADLVALESALSRLALDERAGAPRGFEDRLMAASFDALARGQRAAAREPALGQSDRAVAGVIYRRLSWRLRLAAAVMLTAGVGIAVLAVWGVKWGSTGTAGTGGTLVAQNDASSDVDSMLAAVEAIDTLLPLDGQIADADASESSLLNDVLNDWPTNDDEHGVAQ